MAAPLVQDGATAEDEPDLEAGVGSKATAAELETGSAHAVASATPSTDVQPLLDKDAREDIGGGPCASGAASHAADVEIACGEGDDQHAAAPSDTPVTSGELRSAACAAGDDAGLSQPQMDGQAASESEVDQLRSAARPGTEPACWSSGETAGHSHLSTRTNTAPPTVFGLPGAVLHLEQQPSLERLSTAPVSSKGNPEEDPDTVDDAVAAPWPLHRAVSRTVSRNAVLAALVRNISAAGGVVPTARCNICYEQIVVSDLVALAKCQREAHKTCKSCLCMYFKLRIDDGRVGERDLICPLFGDDECDAKAEEPELEQWLEAETMEKYRRFKRVQENSRIRQCPQCNELCMPKLSDPEDEDSAVVPEMTCASCGQEFCYFHSNAHAVGPEACKEYERQVVKRENAAIANIGVKKCPQCGIMTEKTTGCNHMMCSSCRSEWCWVCGKVITNVGWHYNPLKPGSCAQFFDKAEQRDHVRIILLDTVISFLSWPAALISAMFFGLFFLCMVVASFMICWCFGCACFMTPSRAESFATGLAFFVMGFALLITGLPFIGFWLGWMVLMIPLWLVLKPCGADCDSFKMMISVPPMTLFAIISMFAAVDQN